MAGSIDTVTVEVVRNLLMSVAEETYGIIVRSAYSTNMKERRDVCTAVIDPDGNSVAQVESLAALLGSMLSVVPNVYKKFGRENVKPGDMFIANDPYHGGGNHLPDIVIAAPAFADGKLIGWIANIGHHSDIGGKVPGSTSGDADSLFQEGTRIPVIRIRENDQLIQSVMDLILDNTRVPQEREGDLTAQMSANLIGVQRLQEAYARYHDDLMVCMKELVSYSERRVRAVVRSLPDGEYSFTDYVDGCGDKYPDPLPIKVKVTIAGDDLTFDFTGTAQQIKAPINVPWPCTKAAVFFAVKALMGDDIPANEGINRVLLLVGETMSKIVSRYDKVNTPLFGDAGTATLIEKGERFGKSLFSLHTDGKGAEVMMIPDGGFRNPVTENSFIEETDANGDKRTRLQFRMDGMAVFNFGMSEEPRDVKNIVEAAGMELSDIDLLIYHQANKFMTDFFTKWLKFDKAKTPYSIRKFGNTSSASIPLTIVTELKNAYPERSNVILSGFGAGLSWGSTLVNLTHCKISELVEL